MYSAVICLGLLLSANLKEVVPVDDLVITESVRVVPGEYEIVDEGEPGVIRIEGNGLVVIMDGVVINGARLGVDPETLEPTQATPDEYTGTGLVVTGNDHLIFGGMFHGFKVGVHVDGGSGQWLMAMNVSGNYAQRLKSTPEAEDKDDWLWPHFNDAGEWAEKYGAGMWVRGAKDIRILTCVGRVQQNGLLLDRVENALVKRCDFSFNSGWGIALWRSSDNVVENNLFDFCVRGYSHGVYERGQDSAGILVFEQSHRNRFFQNSATHGGDGFFLYAGHETTKRTGEGGSNDNVVEENDFSHAVANGIEATFSTGNRFLKNRLDGCNYGIWAGYSRKSVFEANLISGCKTAGIAIEHGSENVIRGNLIEDCRRGVWLWWDEDPEFLESVYGEKNRTDSADTLIENNVIHRGEVGVLLDTSTKIRVIGNWIADATKEVETRGECEGIETVRATEIPLLALPERVEQPGMVRGRDFIVLREWGPYDFLEPLVHPARREGDREAGFRVLGTTGGVKIFETEGDVEAALDRQEDGTWTLEVTAKEGAGAYVPFKVLLATRNLRLEASGALFQLFWDVQFWNWTVDPREDPEAFAALLATEPLLATRVLALDFPFKADGPGGLVEKDRFATVAETEFELAPGRYEIRTTSDDGIRVYFDGELVIDNWDRHGPEQDTALLVVTEGPHKLRVEHFEIDGWAWLGAKLRRVD